MPDAPSDAEVRILNGKDAILRRAGLLQNLAARCGQEGAMHWLGYFLGGEGARWKDPVVILFVEPGAAESELRPEQVCAAALLCQIAPLGLKTGAFCTDDWEGRRTIIAPPARRAEVAQLAVEALLDRGAHLVLASYQTPVQSHDYSVNLRGLLWAEHSRSLTHHELSLEPTYDGTLRKFGKRTRFNLNYYRRRLLAKVPCEFVPDACAILDEDAYLELNSRSLNPAPAEECRRRFRALRELDGSFLIGIREQGGAWLSTLGGWRHGPVTTMHHQMNASGHERDSLATVMRSFFLQHEIERGTRKINFHHGTAHLVSHAFNAGAVHDLLVRRKSFRAAALRAMARLCVSPRVYTDTPYFTGSLTFFAAALVSENMAWHAGKPKAVWSEAPLLDES